MGGRTMAKTKVLIADDDTELLANVALHLRNEEYAVVCAADGLEALTAAQREEPDVLLVTVGLMVDEHSSLCDELHEHPALMRIPLVYMVGERAVRLGNVPRVPARSVIFKPVHTDELFTKIGLAVSGTGKSRLGGHPARGGDVRHERAA